MSYTEVLGTRGYTGADGKPVTLDAIDAPLTVLSGMYGVPVARNPAVRWRHDQLLRAGTLLHQRRFARYLRDEPPWCPSTNVSTAPTRSTRRLTSPWV